MASTKKRRETPRTVAATDMPIGTIACAHEGMCGANFEVKDSGIRVTAR